MNTYDIITANKSFSGADMVAMCHMTAPDGTKEIYTLGSLQTLTYSIHMQRSPIRAIGNINAKDYVMGPRTIAGSLVFAVFNKHFAYEAMESIRRKYNPRYAFLADELPPFDITVSFANEYGAQAKLVLYGIRLVNEGQVMSVNDIYTENTYQFVATDMEYLTDVAGYSSYISSAPKVRFIQASNDYDASTPGKDITDQLGNRSNDISHKVGIKITNINSAFGIKKGLAKITLEPAQTSGFVVINGDALQRPIVLDVSEYRDQPIFIALDTGRYLIEYINADTESYSGKKQFIMTSIDVSMPEQNDTPIIESCTDKRISVYSNVAAHTRLNYAEVNGSGDLTWNSISLSGRRAMITGLNPGTKYLIYTSGSGPESSRVYAETTAFASAPYEALKQYMIYNEDRLQYGTIDAYVATINEAKTLSATYSQGLSVPTALIMYKSKVEEKIKSLLPAQFPTYDEYTAKVDELTLITLICQHLVNIANMLSNNATFAFNPAPLSVAPPAPELTDALNCVFLFGHDIEKLEFYRQYDNTAQFASEAKKVDFYPHNTGKQAFRFLGKPGINHYVYAFNKRGQRSPRFEFYVMTDDERARYLESYNSENGVVNALIRDAEKNIGAEISKLGLDSNNKKRLLIEAAKVPTINIFPAPTIIESSQTEITVDVSNNKMIGMFATQFYAIISEIDEALKKKTVYKQLITSDTVKFTTESAGIKPDMMYAVWIENKEGIQVSPCTTVNTYTQTNDLIAEEDKIELYKVEKILNRVRYSLSNKININDDISAAINNLSNDSTVSYKNVFEKLALNLISYVPKLPNIDSLLNATFEAMVDITFRVDNNFFNSVQVKNNNITFSARSQEYMINVYGLTYSTMTNTAYKVNTSEERAISYDKTSRYLVVFATSADLYTKSGVLFIDTATETVKAYKMVVGG